MKTASLLFLSLCLVLTNASAKDIKIIKVGKMPESVTRGFGDKLYVTMINGDVPAMARRTCWKETPPKCSPKD